jgi:hypothetical protein
MKEQRYKVKINDEFSEEFKRFLTEMKVDFKVTPYTKTLFVWGITLSSREQINAIKALSYVKSFERMPILTLS